MFFAIVNIGYALLLLITKTVHTMLFVDKSGGLVIHIMDGSYCRFFFSKALYKTGVDKMPVDLIRKMYEYVQPHQPIF